MLYDQTKEKEIDLDNAKVEEKPKAAEPKTTKPKTDFTFDDFTKDEDL